MKANMGGGGGVPRMGAFNSVIYNSNEYVDF